MDGDALRRDAKNITRVKALEHPVASHEKSEEGRRNVDDSSVCSWESFWGLLMKHSCIIIEVRMVVIALLLALVLVFGVLPETGLVKGEHGKLICTSNCKWAEK